MRAVLRCFAAAGVPVGSFSTPVLGPPESRFCRQPCAQTISVARILSCKAIQSSHGWLWKLVSPPPVLCTIQIVFVLRRWNPPVTDLRHLLQVKSTTTRASKALHCFASRLQHLVLALLLLHNYNIWSLTKLICSHKLWNYRHGPWRQPVSSTVYQFQVLPL